MDFADLPTDVQEEAWLAAAGGHRHPDPEVAKAAEAWAESFLARGRRTYIGPALGGALESALGGFGGGIGVAQIRKRRQYARQILALRDRS